MSKELTLNDLIKQKIDPKIQAVDISTQIKDIQQKLEKQKITIDPEITRSFQRLSESYKKSTESIATALKKAVSMNSIFLSNSSLHLPLAVNKTLKNIDFNRIREGLRIRLEAYENSMGKFDKDLWAIDRDMFDLLDEFESEDTPSDETIEQYVEERIDSYMDYFKTDEIYNKYALILEQSYSAFKTKQYALATFPLFSVIEGLIGTTFEEYEIDITLKPKLKHHKNKLYFKLVDYVENTEDELAINLLFFRRVFKVFEEIFKPSWEEHPENINRNWIMHGAFNYESITRKDVLKLYQLIKAAEVVRNISFEKDDKEAS
ncbi:hypothetical protein [Alkalihalobacillus sp. BA299]|uniref:hypothetical protein n=1 Tax=Alkalihalobacillus sp. BA299 TaxID=2815938 RepID=UPI001FFE0B02|nr:hypothetical protein [Alkalihalobacillus sp. BA299]